MRGLSVGVVFGGRSVEHDVSIVTAHQVMAALAARHDVVPIYITRDGKWLTSPELNDLVVHSEGRAEDVGEEAFLFPGPRGGLHIPGGRLRGPRRVTLDVVVPAVHGTFGEDGTLQGVLEMANIPYTGSGVAASAVGMDKVLMKSVFAAAGIPVLPHQVVEADDLDSGSGAVLEHLEAHIGYPAFVKPTRLGSSVGIGKAVDREGLRNVLDVARRYDTRIMVEPALEGCLEINCSVMGGAGMQTSASVCEQPVAWEDYLSFSDKYLRPAEGKSARAGAPQPGAPQPGKTQGMAASARRIPAPISPELTKQVQEHALTAFSAVGASGVARVDSFVREATGEMWVMEINTIPGSFSFYLWEASGVPFEDLLGGMIDTALAGHSRRAELMFSFDSKMLQTHGRGKSGG